MGTPKGESENGAAGAGGREQTRSGAPGASDPWESMEVGEREAPVEPFAEDSQAIDETFRNILESMKRTDVERLLDGYGCEEQGE